MTDLPNEVVEADHKLEQSASKASSALAKHRWHWTLDESNPDRVGFAVYGKAVSRAHSTISAYAKGYAAWAAGDGSSTTTLLDQIQRANVSTERAEILEAVAEANQVNFQTARQNYTPDVKRVRDAVEKAVERQPEMTAEEKTEYVKRTANTIARSKVSEAKRRAERAQQRSAMFMRIDAKLAHARADLRDVLEFGRDLGLSDDEIEDVKGALAKIKSFADLIDLALTGSMDVDWDAELAKIGGDS